MKSLFTQYLKHWILLILMAFFAIAAPGFLSVAGMKNLAVYTAIPLILALGQTFVIISGGIDLSVGAILGLCGVVSALILKEIWILTESAALSISIGMLCGLFFGTMIGVLNGAIIAKLKVPAFVVTLGMLGICRGATYVLSSGHSIIQLPPSLGQAGNYQIFGIMPVSVFIAILLALLSYFILSKTRLGRYTYSIGGNRQASLRAGVPVDRYVIKIYALSGFMAAFAGILVLARFATGSPLAGMNDELDSIAAVVIGGASLFGGVGSISGTVIGALIIGVLLVGLVILNVPAYWQMIVVGGILIIAVFIDNMRHRRQS